MGGADFFTKPPKASRVADVDCQAVSLELHGGYRGYARFFAADDTRRAVVYLHGIQSHGGWFLKSCDHLRQHGCAVLAPDRRGCGMNREDRGHCDSAGELLDDLDRAVGWLRERCGIAQVDLVAVSWSGKLALAYAAMYGEKVRSVTLVAPGLCPRVDIALTEKIFMGVGGIAEPKKLHEIPLKAPALFTENAAMRAFLENDPLAITQTTASFLITSTRLDMKVPRILSEIKAPVYLFLAGQDRIIDNAATIELLRPVLCVLDGFDAPAVIYPEAHHTLDFEKAPEVYFRDLLRVLA